MPHLGFGLKLHHDLVRPQSREVARARLGFLQVPRLPRRKRFGRLIGDGGVVVVVAIVALRGFSISPIRGRVGAEHCASQGGQCVAQCRRGGRGRGRERGRGRGASRGRAHTAALAPSLAIALRLDFFLVLAVPVKGQLQKERVGVPGFEGPSTRSSHFQAGQRAHLEGQVGGLVCLEVRAYRARDIASRRAKGRTLKARCGQSWPSCLNMSRAHVRSVCSFFLISKPGCASPYRCAGVSKPGCERTSVLPGR